MKVLFYCYDFKKENLSLMPWRYFYEIAMGLLKREYDVSLLSVENNNKELYKYEIDGIKIFPITAKGLFSNEYIKKLLVGADILIWSSSPLTYLFYSKFKKLNRPIILLFTGPFYSVFDVLRAQTHGVPFKQLLSHYKNAMHPLRFTAKLINSPIVRSAVVLSNKNASILRKKGCDSNKLKVIPPGYENTKIDFIEKYQLKQKRKKLGLPENKKILMYLGSLYQIRGVNLLLNAFSEACKKTKDIMLLILARTEDNIEIDLLLRRINKLGLKEKVIIVSCFLEKKKVQEYLSASDIVVLPFILVPSDMPLGALEAMALGKPVITTDVDGMKEMVRDKGIVVKSANKKELAKAISSLTEDLRLYKRFQTNCLKFIKDYSSWDDVVENFSYLLQ